MLVANGADVNAKDNDGITTLMLESMNDHSKMVKILLANGADVNAKDNSGNTALSLAKRYSKTAQALIKAGAKK